MLNKSLADKESRLIIVGGPGASGLSTIAKRLALYFKLEYVYAGGMMNKFSKEEGYAEFVDFLEYVTKNHLEEQYDVKVDRKVLEIAKRGNVLIDSKVMAALATKYHVPAAVKIWIDCDLEERVRRTFMKENLEYDINSPRYAEVKEDLIKRLELDARKFNKLYGIDYLSPKKYNDIVINSSKLNVTETLNLLLRLIADGEYIE